MGGGLPECHAAPVPYETVAVLGDLPRQTYTVNWTTSSSHAEQKIAAAVGHFGRGFIVSVGPTNGL